MNVTIKRNHSLTLALRGQTGEKIDLRPFAKH